MRAVVYKEIHLKGNKSTTYYVLEFIHNQNNSGNSVRGCQEVRSVKESHLIDEIMKIQRQSNLRIVPGKLPPGLSFVEKTVLGSDSVEIIRKPYDLSFLMKK